MARPSKYTPEFRRRAVEEVLDRERTVIEVARSLSITSPETLRRWVVQARIDRGLVVGPTTEELAEIKALRKEVADQQRTIEILKAATTFFAQEANPHQR
jgi:transposase